MDEFMLKFKMGVKRARARVLFFVARAVHRLGIWITIKAGHVHGRAESAESSRARLFSRRVLSELNEREPGEEWAVTAYLGIGEEGEVHYLFGRGAPEVLADGRISELSESECWEYLRK